MATLAERIRNVLDDHLDRERERARQEGYRGALYETRDALLGAALEVKQSWRQQLVRDGEGVRNFADARHTTQLETLNRVFETLRQKDPGITSHLNIEQIRSQVVAEAQRERLSLNANTYNSARQELNFAEYQSGYQFMRERLDRSLARELNRISVQPDPEQAAAERRIVHDLAIQASRDVRDNWGDRGRGGERLDHPDFDLGRRKALMDWSHEHNHRLIQKIQTEGITIRPVHSDLQQRRDGPEDQTRYRLRIS